MLWSYSIDDDIQLYAHRFVSPVTAFPVAPYPSQFQVVDRHPFYLYGHSLLFSYFYEFLNVLDFALPSYLFVWYFVPQRPPDDLRILISVVVSSFTLLVAGRVSAAQVRIGLIHVSYILILFFIDMYLLRHITSRKHPDAIAPLIVWSLA